MSTVRTNAQISQSILSSINADPILGPLLTSPSATALYTLFANIIAASQATEEGLINIYQNDIEAIAAQAAPASPQWIQDQAFNFQYSATNPQTIQFNTTSFAPYWPIINPSYRIITRCAVTDGSSANVQIKVATGTGSFITPLNTSQLSAFQSFMNYIKPAGIIYNCISYPPDLIYCAVAVTYTGTYSGIINSSLLNAYNNYLSNLPFNGLFRLSDLQISLMAVPGVLDISFANVNIRSYNGSSYPAFVPGGPYNIVNNYTEIPAGAPGYGVSYLPISGYLADENTTGYDFVSSLILTAI